LASAEVWTTSTVALHVAAADPESRRAPIPLGNAEREAFSRAGSTGTAWAKVWLPGILAGREDRPVRLAPIVHSGELLGALVVERPADAGPVSEEQDRTLVELARQVALTLHNVRLDSALQASLDEVRRQAQDLQASRGRIVAASDAARRSIERNLHDGAQQHLVALAVKVRLARQFADRDPDRAKAILDELGTDVDETIQQLRDLAHGIYPPLLADKGLADALTSAARRSVLPATLASNGVGRYPPEKEAAVYFCCLEALQNAAKYAGEAATVAIRLHEEAGGLVFEVRDDGAGFDVASRGSGAGFVNMNDRLGAVGGSLRIESTPGHGTRVTGVIPLDRTD
jgi:signal transduction histidine kinase